MTAGGRAPQTVLLVAPFDHGFNSHSNLQRRALERLGCSVRTFDMKGRGWFGYLRRRDRIDRLAGVLERHRFDAVLVTGPRSFDPEFIERFRGRAGRWLWWCPEAPLDRPGLDQSARAHDAVFTGYNDAAAELSDRTGRLVRYLPPACDPSVHRPMRSRDRFRANVVFAGRATPRRVELLSELVEFGIAVWGRGWRRTSLKEYCRGERVNDADYVKAYAGSSVAVNIHREASGPWQSGCNQRVFELAAMGTAQVVDYRADLERHFMPGRHLLAFDDSRTLRDSVKALLLDPSGAEEMGRRARATALSEHTYMHRMVELLHSAELG